MNVGNWAIATTLPLAEFMARCLHFHLLKSFHILSHNETTEPLGILVFLSNCVFPPTHHSHSMLDDQDGKRLVGKDAEE